MRKIWFLICGQNLAHAAGRGAPAQPAVPAAGPRDWTGAELAERLRALGTVTAIDEHSCVLDTGADSAVYLGLLGTDFTATGPPELMAMLRELPDRYRR